MSEKSYSQFGEDMILAALLPATGNLIDVGAWEPFNLSNSRLLIERGWDATLVEFSPHPARELVKEYGNSDRVRVIAAALTPGPRHIEPYQITDDALSSNNVENLAIWRAAGGYFGTLYVPTVSVKQLLAQFYGDKQVNFVNIDAEGSSVELAIEFMNQDHGHQPDVICVEHDNALVRLMETAQGRGYRQEWMNACNVILVKR